MQGKFHLEQPSTGSSLSLGFSHPCPFGPFPLKKEMREGQRTPSRWMVAQDGCSLVKNFRKNDNERGHSGVFRDSYNSRIIKISCGYNNKRRAVGPR